MNIMSQREAWEKFYRNQPRPWGGSVEIPPIPRNSRVMELGCGGGRLLLPLLRSRPAPELVGVDIARTALIDMAKDAAGVLVQADAVSLPFLDGSFGLVICRHVLEHLPGQGRKAAAAELLRILGKGGRLHLEAFSVRDARFGKGREVERRTFLRGDGIICHYFEEGETRHLFGDASAIALTRREWSERAGRERMGRESLVADILR